MKTGDPWNKTKKYRRILHRRHETNANKLLCNRTQVASQNLSQFSHEYVTILNTRKHVFPNLFCDHEYDNYYVPCTIYLQQAFWIYIPILSRWSVPFFSFILIPLYSSSPTTFQVIPKLIWVNKIVIQRNLLILTCWFHRHGHLHKHF